MTLQNIGASNKDDAFYRYKMPRMITKIEGRGNGIRTKIENMADIAKALDRPASYITKYFGYELGAQNKFDEKRTSFINGAHDNAKLAGLLDNFIKKYVQCYGCGNPETKILTKSRMVSLECAACGFVSGVQTNDNLTKFLLRKAEEQKRGKDKKAMQRNENKILREVKAADKNKKKGVSSKESSADGSKKAAAGGSDGDHSTSPSFCQDGGNVVAAGEDGDDVQLQTDTSLEAMKQRMQEQLSTVSAELVTLCTDEPERKKKESLHNDVAVYGSVDRDNYDDKQTIRKASPYNELIEEIKANLGNAITAIQLKEVLSSSTLPSQDVMNALFEALFDGVGKGFKEEVVKSKEYLAAAVPDEGFQILLLLAMEVFGSKCSALALREIPYVLKALYYDDILEEETILHWYNVAVASGKNSQVLQNVKPFVDCLQSADYESEEE